MGLLVKFIAVDSKNENIEQAKYIQEIFNKVYSNGLIKRLMVSLDELPFKLGPVKEADEEGNVFVIEFNSMENDSSDNWELVFRYGTYDASKQLEVEIYSDTYTVDKDNNYLEILKLTVKKAIVKDWKSIIWLIDKDSECLSIELYPRIYKIENLMRELINEVMAKQYGSSWWDSFVPANIKEKHSKRLKEYKAKVPAFNNVDERLMSIDIDDLGELVTLKRYKWNPVFDEKISLLLNGVQSYDDNKIRELLIKQRAVDKDLWQDQFSRYLPADFKERFFAFARDRNHIMHNKLIDRTAYTQIKVSGEKIEDDLIRAIEKLSTIILSHEEQEEIEKQKQIELGLQAIWEHECKERDAHVSIRDYDEIRGLFGDSLWEIVNQLEEVFHFRRDIEIEGTHDTDRAETGELMSVQSKVDGTLLLFTYNMSIIDEEGADSTLSIYGGANKKHLTNIIYKNASVEFDPGSGLYMPIIQDELGSTSDAADDLADFINEEITNYRDNAESGDTAEFVYCSECGEDSICINEDVLPMGTCMSCGYVNEMHQCDRCGEVFNSGVDGKYEDYVSMCQNCLDRLEAE